MMQTRNMAAVFLSGTLPPFARPGNKVDVTVSSAGDARSLEGGVLLLAPMYGPDGQIYAQAQGPMVSGRLCGDGQRKQQVSELSDNGADSFGGDCGAGSAARSDADANAFAAAGRRGFPDGGDGDGKYQSRLGRTVAHAVDSRRIEIQPAANEDIPALLARVEEVEVEVFPRAKVVVNERTGTVVIGGNVRLQPVTILHGGLVVNIVNHFEVSQPNPLGQGSTQVVEQTTVQAQDKPANRIELKEGATVDDLVENLQQIGATARDIVSILQAMKEAGALEAELEVL
jgi:flagellar P-ring protein precursor FlgI